MSSAAELIAAYRDRRASPLEVARRALEAARAFDRRDPPMRLFISLDEADVLRQAEAATSRWMAGAPLGSLDGVPIAVKDEIDVAGYPTTSGTSFLGKSVATKDALSVARLRRAGAIIFGKTNMHEIGIAPSGLNPHHGTARNPYDPERDTGGSSSGSGAAVASGLVPIALGNDGGGSIRIPGALCGVPGLKATYGRVPTDGIALTCWSLEHSGPLGATVEDVVLALSIMTDEPTSLPAVGPLRIGLCESWWSPADDEVKRVVRAAMEQIPDGHIVPIDLPHVERSLPVGALTFTVESAEAMSAHVAAEAPFTASTRMGLELARGISAIGFVHAQRVRALIARDFEAAFSRVDVILTPTTARTAPRYHADALNRGEIDEDHINAMVWFTFAQNLTGMPAMQVPCGYDSSGMPIGMQIIAPHGEDARALAVARAVERLTERRRPRVFVDLLA